MNIQSQNKISEIPGLYSGDQAKPWSNDGLTEDQPTGDGTDGFDPQDKTSMILLRGKSLLTDLTLEKDSLDKNFVHAHRLLDAEIARVQCGGELKDTGNSNIKQFDKVYISTRDQKKFNLLGRLLGPKGMTVKRIQAETQTKMSILGRGSMRDKKKEEELRSTADPTYQHLKDELHVLIEANPPYSVVKLAAGVAEVKKMLIPLEPGMEDIVAAKFLDPMMQQQGPGGPGPGGSGSGGFSGSPGFPGKALLPSPREERAMRGGGRGGSISGGGRGRGGGGGGGFMGGRGRGRGGTPRGGGGRGGRGRGMGGGDRGGANGRLMRGGGAGGGSWDSGGGGGPMRTRSAGGGGGGYDSYDRRSEYSEHRGSSGYDDYQPHVGYGSERIGGGGGGGGGGEGSYRRPDTLSNTVSDNDPYYSSFSDPPSSSTRNFSVSRDYNHGSSAGDAGSTPSWKSSQSSRRDHRYHPYQQSGSFSDY